MIKFEKVTKVYPGMDHPAVDQLSFEVPTGEICTLVGPSGCGKTTSLKMVNRLIEPTGGDIYVLDENDELVRVMDTNPIQLRRKIGYVIQQIGLFPHRTIYENIATVPRLLKWDEKRTRQRAEDLMEVSNMPVSLLDRFPHELSGGQRQRVGVARGMAVDPPVMLMDEPFGAIDPINRTKLQNEFLRLQQEIKKTILFVTHDIDEAIKMSDKICILNVGGILEQFDTPTNILSNPKNEFVDDFVGADRALKQLNLIRVSEIMDPDPPLVKIDQSAEQAREFMREHDIAFVFVVDSDNALQGYLTRRHLRDKSGEVREFVDPVDLTLPETTTLRDALSEMLLADYSNVSVVDANGRVQGVINTQMIQTAISESTGRDENEEEA